MTHSGGQRSLINFAVWLQLWSLCLSVDVDNREFFFSFFRYVKTCVRIDRPLPSHSNAVRHYYYLCCSRLESDGKWPKNSRRQLIAQQIETNRSIRFVFRVFSVHLFDRNRTIYQLLCMENASAIELFGTVSQRGLIHLPRKKRKKFQIFHNFIHFRLLCFLNERQMRFSVYVQCTRRVLDDEPYKVHGEKSRENFIRWCVVTDNINCKRVCI